MDPSWMSRPTNTAEARAVGYENGTRTLFNGNVKCHHIPREVINQILSLEKLIKFLTLHRNIHVLVRTFILHVVLYPYVNFLPLTIGKYLVRNVWMMDGCFMQLAVSYEPIMFCR